MHSRPDARTIARAAALVAALGLLGCGAELHRVSQRHAVIARLTSVNTDEERAAQTVLARLAEQEIALRDLVLANDAREIQAADARFEQVTARYDESTSALFNLFNQDREATSEEKALLETVRRARLDTTDPVRQVVALGLANQDEAATKVLISDAMPHQQQLQSALNDLATLQKSQNQVLADAVEQADGRTFVCVLGVAVIGAVLAVGALVVDRRRRPAPPAPRPARHWA